MASKVDKMTDAELKEMERRISEIYADARDGLAKSWDEYINGYTEIVDGKEVRHMGLQERYAQEYKAYKDGKYTKKQFDSWYQAQVGRGERWAAQRDEMARRLVDADKVASAYVNDKTPGIYALNANFTAYEIEQGSGIAFNLVNEQAVKELMQGKNRSEFRTLSVNPKRDYKWNKERIQNALTSGILQGSSIDKIADKFFEVMEGNKNAAIRNARTAVTSAQNGGRLSTFSKAEKMGIYIKKQWVATLDNRTRDSHQKLDGEIAETDEVFSNGCRFPGDPGGEPGEVYNCRCTMCAILPKYNSKMGVERAAKDASGRYQVVKGVTYNEKHNSISYEDWLAGKAWDDEPIREIEDNLLNALGAQAEAQSKLDKIKVKSYDGIWKDSVKTSDWEAKKDSIPLKDAYYNQEIAKAEAVGDFAKADELRKKQKALHEFDKKGQEWAAAYKKKAAADSEVSKIRNSLLKAGGYDPMGDPFSPERKNAAIWAKSTKEADDVLRSVCGSVWRSSSKQQREAIYGYTTSYHPINEPLRGTLYGPETFKGVGNVDLNCGGKGREINWMTELIEKSEYQEDFWLQRGCGYKGMDRFFKCDEKLLRYGTQQELETELLGKPVTDYGFMSCGVAKGKGFSGDIILNVYAPRGTKMMYAEPFSYYGHGARSASWDGLSTQATFGSESEIILQQGTNFRVIKVERTPGTLYVDIEVIGREPAQVWK